MKKNSKTILIAAGGTGGHVFPALAIAKYLQKNNCAVHWIGTKQGIEYKIVKKNNIPLYLLQIGGLRGKGIKTKLTMPWHLFKACITSIYYLYKIKPKAVLVMGGYVSGPIGVASWLLRIPLLIHEQNAIAGLTNKLLSYIATSVMISFENSFPQKINVTLTGNPIRQELLSVMHPSKRYAQRTGKINLLIIGGSQGALILNNIVPKALGLLETQKLPNIWHQTGYKYYNKTKNLYKDIDIESKTEPFIDNMEQAYHWADLVIARSGALTVAELSAIGLASILIPYAIAVDDHQTANAQYLARNGAAVIIAEKNLTEEELAKKLILLIKHRENLLNMALMAKKVMAHNATEKVSAKCLEVFNHAVS